MVQKYKAQSPCLKSRQSPCYNLLLGDPHGVRPEITLCLPCSPTPFSLPSPQWQHCSQSAGFDGLWACGELLEGRGSCTLCTVVMPSPGPGTWCVLTDCWCVAVERHSPALPVRSWPACRHLSRTGIGPAGLCLGSLIHCSLGNGWASLIRTGLVPISLKMSSPRTVPLCFPDLALDWASRIWLLWTSCGWPSLCLTWWISGGGQRPR